MRVLLVEDDLRLAELMNQKIAAMGLEVDHCASCDQALELTHMRDYVVIVLDRGLPDGDGKDLCHILRRRGISSPILMLTGFAETQSKVEGLDAGADDYQAKPFDMTELLARIRALLRRSPVHEEEILIYEDLEMNETRNCAARGGQRIRLTPKEWSLLLYLLRNRNRVCTKAQIRSEVWNADDRIEDNLIEAYISRLRKKIDKGRACRLIHTVNGMGYMLSYEPLLVH